TPLRLVAVIIGYGVQPFVGDTVGAKHPHQRRFVGPGLVPRRPPAVGRTHTTERGAKDVWCHAKRGRNEYDGTPVIYGFGVVAAGEIHAHALRATAAIGRAGRTGPTRN